MGLFSLPVLACHQIKKIGSSVLNITNNPTATVNIEIKRNQNSQKCEYVVGLSKGSSNNGSYSRYLQRNQVPIQIKFWDNTMSQLIYDYPDASPPANLIVGSFNVSGGSNTKTTSLRIDFGPVPYNVSSGRYSNQFHLKLWTRPLGSQGSFTLANDKNFEVRYDLAKSLDVSLVQVGAPFNLLDTNESVNFGELSQNQTKSFDMLIGNNTSYSYSLNSLNNGRLLRQGGNPAQASNKISYQFKIGATTHTSHVVLNAGSFPYSSTIVNPPAGSVLRFPIEVKIIDNPSVKNQGQYQDTITIDVIAN